VASEKIGVLLMAYGAANSLDEIEPYLNDIYKWGQRTIFLSMQCLEILSK
jgi:protoheme ferro-lyase